MTVEFQLGGLCFLERFKMKAVIIKMRYKIIKYSISNHLRP